MNGNKTFAFNPFRSLLGAQSHGSASFIIDRQVDNKASACGLLWHRLASLHCDGYCWADLAGDIDYYRDLIARRDASRDCGVDLVDANQARCQSRERDGCGLAADGYLWLSSGLGRGRTRGRRAWRDGLVHHAQTVRINHQRVAGGCGRGWLRQERRLSTGCVPYRENCALIWGICERGFKNGGLGGRYVHCNGDRDSAVAGDQQLVAGIRRDAERYGGVYLAVRSVEERRSCACDHYRRPFQYAS